MVWHMIRILLVEDNPGDVRLLKETLAEADASDLQILATADRLMAAGEILARQEFDLVLLDLSLPDSHGLQTIASVRELAPLLAVVVLTGLDDETLAMDALRKGAQDYLVKGQTDSRLLVRSVRYSLERRKAQVERERLISDLQEALTNIKRLSGLLPICAWCKKIRDDKGYWQQVEQYVHDHSEADFSHSICPECSAKVMAQMETEGEKVKAKS